MWRDALPAQNVSCDPNDIAHLEQELAGNQHNLGVGVIDQRTGMTRLFPYDETEAFSRANPQLQVMAGHEAAATMAAIPLDQARGFILGKQRGDWHVFNLSHLNHSDAQPNPMQMSPGTFQLIVVALQAAGVHNPIQH